MTLIFVVFFSLFVYTITTRVASHPSAFVADQDPNPQLNVLVGKLRQSQLDQQNTTFSGFFRPDSPATSAAFSASFLVTKERFFTAESEINVATSMSAVSFAVVYPPRERMIGIMTRDYLDFFVEHLSSLTNQLPAVAPPLFDRISITLSKLIHRYRTIAELSPAWKLPGADSRVNSTVAVIPYCSIPFSNNTESEYHISMRLLYLQATVWSVRVHFPRIVIYVSTQDELEEVQSLALPIWRLEHIDDEEIILQKPLLPRNAMLHLMDELRGSRAFRDVTHIFFTEADQIIHLRHTSHLYNTLNSTQGYVAIVPHRMQVLPVKQIFDSSQHYFFDDSVMKISPQAEVITEELIMKGSCCDYGLLEPDDCDNWWYLCSHGLRNLSPWIRSGEIGFPFLPMTEHRLMCRYSPTPMTCPSPTQWVVNDARKCFTLSNTSGRPFRRFNYDHICSAESLTVEIGPNTPDAIIQLHV